MKILKLLTFALLVSVVSLTSCEKEGPAGKDGIAGIDGKDGADGEDGKDGLNGEKGLDGKDGINGKDGIDGKDGVDGKDGTAQLKVFNFSVSQTSWTNSGTANQVGAYTFYNYTNPQITPAMLDSSMVMVYQVIANKLLPLPRVLFTGTGTVLNLNYEISPGLVELKIFANDWGQYLLTGTSLFRLVIIPANAASVPGFSWDNYEEIVKKYAYKETI